MAQHQRDPQQDLHYVCQSFGQTRGDIVIDHKTGKPVLWVTDAPKETFSTLPNCDSGPAAIFKYLTNSDITQRLGPSDNSCAVPASIRYIYNERPQDKKKYPLHYTLNLV